MNWDDLRHFACFAEAGSLSGAARHLKVEHATIARRIAALEAELNLKLVDRRGRRLVLTPAGKRIAALSAQMQGEAESVLRYARSATMTVSGDVTISAPPAFAAALMAAPLTGLRKQHPELNIFISGDIHTVSLERREADIAIRLHRPEHGALTAVKLGEIAFRLYACPDYLSGRAESDWAYIRLGGALAEAPQQSALGDLATGRGLAADQIEMQHALVRAGAGVAMLPDFLAASDPALTRAAPGAPPLTREVWMICHTDMAASAPVRAVFETLKTMRF
ncbi:LysR family transcriptional regulator [Salipiger abyssi]|uniref:LysR family transcriptional regulator n=1 Tax=Salipiger abyssi TaxID=1250539 RepID=UPI001A8DF180|nr:LysR family transcriptional regulator [Salipiger abyssi]MBN9889031.1 LysR family transcriptional regulator [Salipiger abyssi]